MSDVISSLAKYFEYSFVQYAMIVAVLISLCAGILGVNLVLKRFSNLGESLSHATFLLMTLGTVIGFIDNIFFTILVVIIISLVMNRIHLNTKIKGDAILTMISSASLGFGYLIMNVSNTSANLAGDVCSTLFGTIGILTLKKYEVVICIILSIVVILIYILLYNKIFAITFDEEFSKVTGVRVKLYNFIISITLSIVIVLSVNLVGSLLISALIIFPALASMRIFKSYKMVVLSSAIFSVVCSSIGILISLLEGTPVGSTIVAVDLVGFIIFYIIGKFRR